MNLFYKSFLLLALSFYSCTQPAKFQLIQIADKYSIELPEYMQPWTGMHTEASLHYKNEERDIYTIIIDENKKELQHHQLNYTLDSYFKSVCSSPPIKNIDQLRLHKPVQINLNGDSALLAGISGNFNHTNIYYQLAVIETKKRFYQILSWTSLDNKELFLRDFNTSLNSFRE